MPAPRPIATCWPRHGLPVTEPLLGAWSEAWGHEAVGTTVRRQTGEKPDAVFCGNDQIARGVIDALRERGLGVPDDVGVIGFDNWEIVAEADAPAADLGRHEPGSARAARPGLTLLSLVGGQPAEPGSRKLPCRLVVRQSCGRPPGG